MGTNTGDWPRTFSAEKFTPFFFFYKHLINYQQRKEKVAKRKENQLLI
jgi:hypothetical protein